MDVSRHADSIWLVVVAQDMVWVAFGLGEKWRHGGLLGSAVGRECCGTDGKYLPLLF